MTERLHVLGRPAFVVPALPEFMLNYTELNELREATP